MSVAWINDSAPFVKGLQETAHSGKIFYQRNTGGQRNYLRARKAMPKFNFSEDHGDLAGNFRDTVKSLG